MAIIFLICRPDKSCHQILVDADTISMTYFFQLRDRQIAMDHTKTIVCQFLSLDQKCPLGLVNALRLFLIVFQERILTVQRRICTELISLGLAQLGMCQTQILIGQFP